MRNVLLSLLLAGPVIASAADSVYQGTYSIIPLTGEAKALNNAGQVLGETINPSGGTTYLYLDGPGISPKVFADIPTGYPQRVTAALSDAGALAVSGKKGEPAVITIKGGTVTRIPLPNPSADAVRSVRSINKSGQILAEVEFNGAQELNHLTQLYTPGRGTVAIGGGTKVMGVQVNDAGTVLAIDTKDYQNQPFLYFNGQSRQLDPRIQPAALNNGNVVVGHTGGYGGWTAAMWADGQTTELGWLAGGNYSYATDINDSGEIVGTSTVRGAQGENVYHGFVYRNGNLLDLNTLINRASGWTITGAKAINEKHQILVDAIDKSGKTFSLLLTPDAPASLAPAPAPRRPR
jgi:probable HAF family extracellular repeat protein